MEILIRPDADEVARLAAELIAGQLERRADSVLGLATGRTMERVYAALCDRARAGLPLRAMRSFNLDEYVGIDPEDPRSYRAYMDRHLVRPGGCTRGRTHVPDGMAADLDREAERYEAAIASSGGIDLQLLGLGANGHIGFNEPFSAFDSRTRVVTLAAETRRQNAEMFGSDPEAVPATALTMGIATILEARRIVLVVTGRSKAGILARTVMGPVDPVVSGSVLQWHSDCVLIADEAAAAELQQIGMTST